MSLNPFSMRYLRPEVELIYLLRMRRYRHKTRRQWCHAPEMTASLWENAGAEIKYDRRIQTGSNSVVETAHAQ